MKSLLKYLSPFAPDQSGAVSVFFEFGGLIVILDAGGCTGNICGFDEPRWFTAKSAIYSAGMRDMDAILGRDDKLVRKLADAMEGTFLSFTALIGTPVPAIIATDFRALKRMTAKRTILPVMAVECIGTRLYDRGEEEAYQVLFREFAKEVFPVVKGRVGVLGATPLELSRTDSTFLRKQLYSSGYKEVFVYGMGNGLEDLKRASSVEKNLVLSPAALKTAQFLEEQYRTPWEIWTPEREIPFQVTSGQKVLIIHQQFIANALREKIPGSTVASFFMMKDQYRQEGDQSLHNEEEFSLLCENFDVIIGDRHLKRAARSFKGEWIDLPHYAVSGRLEE